MSNLSTFTNAPSFDYEWGLITDLDDRAASKAAVSNYKNKFLELREQADGILKQDNVAKANCVYVLKESLDHGQFLDVCQQSLGLNKDLSAALASTGRMLMEGDHNDDVLNMVTVMEPRAAQKFLRSDDETKHRYVATFEETGHVPSQRDFSNNTYPQKKVETYESENPFVHDVAPTTSASEVTDRMGRLKVRPVHFVQWLTDQLKDRANVSDDMADALKGLMSEVNRLNGISV